MLDIKYPSVLKNNDYNSVTHDNIGGCSHNTLYKLYQNIITELIVLQSLLFKRVSSLLYE